MSGSKELIIIGTKALSEMVVDIAVESNYEVIGFIDDFTKEPFCMGKPILGGIDELLNNHDYAGTNVFVAIGENDGRSATYMKLKSKGFVFPNLIHPRAEISKLNRGFGENNLVFPFVYFGVQSQIGSGNIFFSGVRINHHNVIGDFNFFAPNVSVGGCTIIGSKNKFGMNSVVSPYLPQMDKKVLEPLDLLT